MPGLTRLFAKHSYDDTVIFGHAKDANLHFMLNERFDVQRDMDRYEQFTEDLEHSRSASAGAPLSWRRWRRSAVDSTGTDAMAYFRGKLRFEIDVMDVADALPSGEFLLVDTRRRASWDHGHILGAGHLPTAEIPSRAQELIPAGTPVVVYSWGGL